MDILTIKITFHSWVLNEMNSNWNTVCQGLAYLKIGNSS